MLVLIAIVLAVGAGLLLLMRQRRWLRLRQTGQGIFISYLTVVVLMGGGEAYFRYFYAAPEGRLAASNWIDRYWQVNTNGFRDREWAAADWQGKTAIAVVGDSFTAGWGIEDPADRFSDVLANALGSDYAVFNLGVPGSSTPEQLDVLRGLPEPPQIVIWQYFLNDIDYAALTLGQNLNIDSRPPIVRESYLADFLAGRSSPGFGLDYWQARYDAYDNPAIWAVHETEIARATAYVEQIDARLIVVIFPNLHDIVTSITYVDRVAQAFEANGADQVIRLFDLAAAWERDALTVSALDGHPSAAFHHAVGDLLFQAVTN